MRSLPKISFSGRIRLAADWAASQLGQKPGRPGLRLLLLGACLWTGFHAAHETLWSWRYWKVDPFALEAPVQWPVTGRHGAALARDAETLRACLPDDATLAVGAPETWAEQRFYLYMWLVYTLPSQRILPPDDPSAAQRASLFLSFEGDGSWSPDPPSGFTRLDGCTGELLSIFGPPSHGPELTP